LDGHIDGLDALRELLHEVNLPLTQPSGCPDLGTGTPEFGDVNCDGSEDASDAALILEYAAGVTIAPTPHAGCTHIGSALSG
ncbi:MAG: hypothetical protein ABI559_10580, partial [Chloroflexota bacterium]